MTIPSKSESPPEQSGTTQADVPSTNPRSRPSLRKTLASVGGQANGNLTDKLKQDIDNRSEMQKYARELHNEKMKTQKLKQEALELKKMKLKLEINSLQGYQVAVVSTDYTETDN